MSQQDNEARLLALVAQWRDEECRHLLERARGESLELLRNTRQRGRRQLHEAVRQERDRLRDRVTAARAELETRRRLHRQRLGSVVLEAIRGRLPYQLAERWADSRSRAEWIRNAVSHALAHLPAGRWRIRHASCFRAADHDILLQALNRHHTQTPELLVDPAIDAGLIIECGPVRLDASIQGLLADSVAYESRLLALLEETGEMP